MCMFTYANKSSLIARMKGVEKFECGACPECLQKKSRKWALRCAMEAKVSPGVMVTLTYDTYKIINGKESTEENPVNPDIPLSKKHCQDFMKRLRKHFPDKKIKYIIAAERGKHTNRAHYHALLFNVQFNDLIKYKKSKRNNIIYKSLTLEKIWSHGICTVDCINLSAKTARYCTKYCAKDSGVDDTFMLFSRGIGEEELMRKFDGKSYWIEGREYSIPREIWQKVIEKRYNMKGYSKYIGRVHVEDVEKRLYNRIEKYKRKYSEENITALYWNMVKAQFKVQKNCGRRFKKQENFEEYKLKMARLRRKVQEKTRLYNRTRSTPYNMLIARAFHRARRKIESSEEKYQRQVFLRDIYTQFRDNDKQYQEYIEYWKRKNEICEINRPGEMDRILALPNNKYWSYKQKAILCKNKQVRRKSFMPPRSNCHGFDPFFKKENYLEKSFAPLSRHYTANDTTRKAITAFQKVKHKYMWENMQKYATEDFVNPFV